MFDIITNKKFIFIFIIITVIAVLSWIFLFPTKEKLVAIQTAKEFPTQQTQQFQNTTGKQEKISNQPISILGISPYNEQSDELESFKKSDPLFEDFEDIVSVFTNPFTSQVSEINPTPQPPSGTDLASIEQQIFDILYPDYFISGLVYTQQVYIEQGFLDENYQKFENFDSEETIFTFVNISIDVFEEQGFYSKEEAGKTRKGVNQIWKNLLEEEKIYWKKKLISSEFYDKILTNRQYYIRKLASRKIARIFETIKNTAMPYAYAADCYRSGAPTPGGANISAPCCNCGLKCRKGRCSPVKECGPRSIRCDIPLGCKNLFGKGRPIIWDSTTKICGVG